MILDSNDDDSEESDFLSIAGEDVDAHLNHYRVPYTTNYGPFGMNNQQNVRGNREQVKFSNEGKIMSLTELAAQKVACHLPFGLVEHFNPPVPEPMQCRIAYWSFPQDEEDVKLYTCLANGNADVFYRAEDLLSLNAVCDMLQVGFHLSANVQFLSENESMECFRVAITFDRRRITSCSCSCMTSSFWCQHVVAVCLQRIREPQEVNIRAPVSESLQRLEKNQLQKFAQYLINELPQQILPAAQKLLDELLSGDEANINKNPAAPDPTAGATINEKTSWCLDYHHLTMDIHRILLKQCTAQPTVCSDIQSLHETAPPSTTEYSQLLRPIRSREPEGIWNLISIVSEMMKRRDPNLFRLLEIMTEEILKFDKIVTWWFETKVSLHSGSTIHFSNTKNPQSTSQHSCSSFCDEIVHLWRLAALNPAASSSKRQQLNEKFFEWHLAILKKHSSMTEGGVNTKTNKRNLLELFPGFKCAMEGSQVLWPDWDEKRGQLIVASVQECQTEKPVKTIKRRKRKYRVLKQTGVEMKSSLLDNASDEQHPEGEETQIDSTSQSEKIGSRTENCDNQENLKLNEGESFQRQEKSDAGLIAGNSQQSALAELEPEDNRRIEDDLDEHDENENGELDELENRPNLNDLEPELRVYFMNDGPKSPDKPQKQDTLEDLIKVNVKRLNDSLETLYAKVEGLHAHGYLEESRILARKVSNEMLNKSNYPSFKQLYALPRRRKKKGSLDNQMSLVTSETLSKIHFLCNVLIDDPANYSLIFKLVMFGVELKRSPAATKPLEVKLISQKQELIEVLKNITLHEEELIILREKAESICERSLDSLSDALTLLILGNYVFDALVLSRAVKDPADASLGFQAALSALGSKMNISEVDHPLLCEGTRRERGVLALTLINHFKDDQEKLDLTMKQLLNQDLLNDVQSSSGVELSQTPNTKKSPAIAQDPNYPSEASAHFMFELAKTVYDKAGGNSTTAHLFRPQIVAQNAGRGIHRKLHMCTLRIALHALGLHNKTSTNWIHRTYNGRASFIHEQALEIGLPAIKFLCENWEGYLTPVEAASIADKAGCSNDVETKRIAAEMAKSCLKYANFLDYNAVSRILVQCIEQTIEMIEEACSEIEQIAENDNVCADVLFATARAWHGLYMKLITDEKHSSYQLNSSTTQEQDIGASNWLATSGQQHLERCQQLNEPLHPFMWDVFVRAEFILTADTPIYKHIDYVRAAFRVGIKALDSLKLTSQLGSKHNPKKLDEILWLLGISKSLGCECLYKFSGSIVQNITDPYILHIIIIEIIRFFETIKLPEDHLDRAKLLMPIYDKCLDRCLWQTKDLMKHISYDQKSCIETVFEIVQTLLTVTKASETALETAQYYWEILKFVERKMDKRSHHRRSRININVTEKRNWIEKFLMSSFVECGCDECFKKRGNFCYMHLRQKFKILHQ